MKRLTIFVLIALPMFLLFACGGSKPHAHYQQRRFHQDKKHFHKVDDATTDHKHHKNNSSKYKKQQASYLKNLHHNKNGTEEGVFYLY